MFVLSMPVFGEPILLPVGRLKTKGIRRVYSCGPGTLRLRPQITQPDVQAARLKSNGLSNAHRHGITAEDFFLGEESAK